MRIFSRNTRWRTNFLVTERSAADISLVLSEKSTLTFSTTDLLISSSFVSRSCLPAIVNAFARSSFAAFSTTA
jgi:hypothetical protein